jgi:anti-sigma regulatory factor (Ser/Thr protein kinase)
VQILDPNRSRGALRDKIEITSDPRQAPRAQALLREVCQMSPDLTTFLNDLNQLQHAVGEVLKYIAEHAYGGQTDRPIRVEASLFVNRFSVRIYHRGEGFDFATAKPVQGLLQLVDAAQCSLSALGERCVFLQKWLKA